MCMVGLHDIHSLGSGSDYGNCNFFALPLTNPNPYSLTNILELITGCYQALLFSILLLWMYFFIQMLETDSKLQLLEEDVLLASF